MGAERYSFTRSARSPRAIAFVAAWWALIAVIYLVLDASPVIAALLGLFSLPALYDIGRGARAQLRITEAEIEWRTGRRGARLPRAQLKSVRLDTRLDFSLRMTLQTHQGGKIRLPYECVPPANDIESALRDADILFERHHFALMS